MAAASGVVLAREFLAFCEAHPELRFWQALLAWSGQGFIWAGPDDASRDDTFYWRVKDRS